MTDKDKAKHLVDLMGISQPHSTAESELAEVIYYSKRPTSIINIYHVPTSNARML